MKRLPTRLGIVLVCLLGAASLEGADEFGSPVSRDWKSRLSRTARGIVEASGVNPFRTAADRDGPDPSAASPPSAATSEAESADLEE